MAPSSVVDGTSGALRWEQPIAPGAGAPAVVGDAVVVAAGDERGSALHAFALADGTERWSSRLEAPSQPDLVPLVDGDRIVTVDQRGTVVAVRAEDGVREWATATDALTTYARPIRVRDALLTWNESGEVVTLDRATGTIRARRRTPGVAVGLVAEERGGAVTLAPGIEGAAFPPYLQERVRTARPDELLYLWDEGPRRLTLLDVSVEVFAENGITDLAKDTTIQQLPQVGSHEAVSFVDVAGVCGVSLGVGEGARVDNTAVGGDQQQGCQLAAQLAALVEPKLP